MMIEGGTKADLVAIGKRRDRYAAYLQMTAKQEPDMTFTFVKDDVRGGWQPVTPISIWLLDEVVQIDRLSSFYSKLNKNERDEMRAAMIHAFGLNADRSTHELAYDNQDTISEVIRIVPKRAELQERPIHTAYNAV